MRDLASRAGPRGGEAPSIHALFFPIALWGLRRLYSGRWFLLSCQCAVQVGCSDSVRHDWPFLTWLAQPQGAHTRWGSRKGGEQLPRKGMRHLESWAGPRGVETPSIHGLFLSCFSALWGLRPLFSWPWFLLSRQCTARAAYYICTGFLSVVLTSSSTIDPSWPDQPSPAAGSAHTG